MIVFVVLGIVALVVLWAVTVYNNLVGLRNRVRNAFAQIDVQLTRRHDLIPNLVEAVKGYMQHERATLEGVVAARNTAVTGLKKAASDPTDRASITGLASAEAALSGALGRLFALVESYPNLKANQNMQQLQEELATTENRVAFARQAFNDSVMSYNTARESFPTSLIAGRFGFEAAQHLEIGDAAKREAPKVSFG